MGSHPINLAVRFLLEIAALIALGWWGWNSGTGAWRFVLALGLPILAAVFWGTFAVPDDPSRSGKAPIPVPGLVRLLFELGFFASASAALYFTGLQAAALIFGIIVSAQCRSTDHQDTRDFTGRGEILIGINEAGLPARIHSRMDERQRNWLYEPVRLAVPG